MTRVFLPPVCFDAGRVILPPETAHYFTVVLRLGDGDEFIALDSAGVQYRARLTQVACGRPVGEVLGTVLPRPDTDFSLTLYQGVPKGKRWPLVLQKCTELGVRRIVPVLSARSVVRLLPREHEEKRTRWQRIALEAAQQCRRPTAPEVASPVTWEAALADWRSGGAHGILLDETLAGEESRSLRRVLAEIGDTDRLALFIGPEGGFAPEERTSARSAGLQPASMGPRILRTETAAIVACALCMYEAGALE